MDTSKEEIVNLRKQINRLKIMSVMSSAATEVL